MDSPNGESEDRAEQPAPPPTGRRLPTPAVCIIRGVVGGVVGGFVGYQIFHWLLRQGYYGLLFPGTLLGLGCGGVCGRKIIPLGIVCAMCAVVLGLYSEWSVAPFVADRGLGYFAAHVQDLRPFTLAMIALGGVMAFWLGQGRNPKPADKSKPPDPGHQPTNPATKSPTSVVE